MGAPALPRASTETFARDTPWTKPPQRAWVPVSSVMTSFPWGRSSWGSSNSRYSCRVSTGSSPRYKVSVISTGMRCNAGYSSASSTGGTQVRLVFWVFSATVPCRVPQR